MITKVEVSQKNDVGVKLIMCLHRQAYGIMTQGKSQFSYG